MAWRRVAMGYMVHVIGESAGGVLGPTQLGVGVSRGPEIFATVMQVALQAHPTWVVCKADFRNAFNECSRLAFLTFVAAHFPLLALALLAAYGAPAYVTALGPQGWVRFLSRRGCMHAGMPCGPALLCCSSAACASPGTLGSSAVSHYRVA